MGFVFSDEMKNKKLDNEAFIKMLYRLYLNREADAGGLNSWVTQLNRGLSREKVVEGFASSEECAMFLATLGLQPEMQ